MHLIGLVNVKCLFNWEEFHCKLLCDLIRGKVSNSWPESWIWVGFLILVLQETLHGPFGLESPLCILRPSNLQFRPLQRWSQSFQPLPLSPSHSFQSFSPEKSCSGRSWSSSPLTVAKDTPSLCCCLKGPSGIETIPSSETQRSGLIITLVLN